MTVRVLVEDNFSYFYGYLVVSLHHGPENMTDNLYIGFSGDIS